MFFDEASEIHEKEVDQLQRIGGRLIIPKVGIRLFLKVLEMGGEQCFKEFSFMRKMAIQCSLTDASHSGNLCHRHRSEEHTSELQSPCNLVCRLLLEKKKKNKQ